MTGSARRAVAILAVVLAGAGLSPPTSFGDEVDGPTAAFGDAVPQEGARVEELRRILPTLRLPPGFRVDLFAVVPDARQIAVAPNGRLVVVGTRGSRVWAVAVAPGAAHAASVRRFVPGLALTLANGVCFSPDGRLDLVERNRILGFDGVEAATATGTVAVRTLVARGSLIPPSEESGGHAYRVCRVGPDGRLRVSLGQPYNVFPPEKLALYEKWGIGGIVDFARDGGDRRVFATGIRNSVGLDFSPRDGVLWFTDNQVDGMGDDVPPGEIDRAPVAGLNFGFPWYGGGRVRTDLWRDREPPAGVVFPEVETVAHAADLGMTFYRGTAFPEPWRGGLFSAQHGSWNRTTPIGARVMFTRIGADGRAAGTEVFAEGWLTPRGAYAGRPVDVAELPDGSLLVSDDHAGALWRISWSGE